MTWRLDCFRGPRAGIEKLSTRIATAREGVGQLLGCLPPVPHCIWTPLTRLPRALVRVTELLGGRRPAIDRTWRRMGGIAKNVDGRLG